MGIGEVHAGFSWGDRKERDHLKDLGESGSAILKWIFRKWDGDMNNIDLAKDRDR
jgi:hypothetical protein